MANIRFIDTDPASQALERGLSYDMQRRASEFNLERQMRNAQVQEGVDAATRAGVRNILGRSSPEAPILSTGPNAAAASHGVAQARPANPEIGGRSHTQPPDRPPTAAVTQPPAMVDRAAPGGRTVMRRDMTPLVSELANTPGGGQAAVRVMQQDDQARDRMAQRALQALARGERQVFEMFARESGMQLPAQIAGDPSREALFARGALEARRLYGARGGRQSAAFVAEYIKNGGDPAAAFQAAQAGGAAAAPRRAAAPRGSVGMNRYKLAQQRAAEKAAAEGRQPTTQDVIMALREIGEAGRKQAPGSPSSAAQAPTTQPAPSAPLPPGAVPYKRYNGVTGGFDAFNQAAP